MRLTRMLGTTWNSVQSRALYFAGIALRIFRWRPAASVLRDAARRRGYDRSMRGRLLEIEQLVAGERPPEDELPQFQQRCREAEEDLRADIASGSPPHNVLRLYAALAEQLKNYPTAASRWEEVLRHEGDEPRVETVFRLLLAYRRLGRIGDATALLGQLDPEVRGTERVRKVERSIQRRIEARQAGSDIRRLVIPGDGAVPPLAALDEALERQGFGRALRGPLADLLARCARFGSREPVELAKQTDDPDLRRLVMQQQPETPPKLIMTSGFGWSGSGAVSDLLRDRIAPFEAYPPPELLMFRTNWGNTPVHLAVSDARRGELAPGTIVDALLTSVLGHAPRNLDGLRFDLARQKSALGHLGADQPNALRLIEACDLLLHDLEVAIDNRCASQPTVLAILAAFIQRSLCLDRLETGGSVLLDNAMHPAALRVLDVLPSATAIVVTRDPRDQFANLRSAAGAGTADEIARPEPFLAAQRKMLESFLSVIRRQERRADVRCVWFEDVVLDASIRDRLLSTLGVPHDQACGPRERHFRPELSAKNVGIHRVDPDQAAMDRIAEGLRPLLEEIHRVPGVQLDGLRE